MSFYTIIFKSSYSTKVWIKSLLFFVFITSVFIISFNFIIDPYNVSKYNLLNIKYKFAADDRADKVTYIKNLDKFDNMLLGSSRVYTINPRVVSDIIGGTTYNFGVGRASVEDHLGIIKFLEREGKLPKNIIIGVDFYTFNKQTPPDKYFLKNKELNFLSYSNYSEDYLSKLYSIDSFRASIKTLKNHMTKKSKSRFDNLGWASSYEDYNLKNIEKEKLKTLKEIDDDINFKYDNFKFISLDKKRVDYYNEIKDICEKNNINLYIFTTPLNPILLDVLYNSDVKYALDEFNDFLSTFKNFTDLYNNPLIYKDIRNFQGATHTSPNAGDLILEIIFDKELSKGNELALQ